MQPGVGEARTTVTCWRAWSPRWGCSVKRGAPFQGAPRCPPSPGGRSAMRTEDRPECRPGTPGTERWGASLPPGALTSGSVRLPPGT